MRKEGIIKRFLEGTRRRKSSLEMKQRREVDVFVQLRHSIFQKEEGRRKEGKRMLESVAESRDLTEGSDREFHRKSVKMMTHAALPTLHKISAEEKCRKTKASPGRGGGNMDLTKGGEDHAELDGK